MQLRQKETVIAGLRARDGAMHGASRGGKKLPT